MTLGHCGGGLYQEIQDEGVAVASRRALDFSGNLVQVADDAAGDRSIVHIGKRPDLTDLFAVSNVAPQLTLNTGVNRTALNGNLQFLTAAGLDHILDSGSNSRVRFSTVGPHIFLLGTVEATPIRMPTTPANFLEDSGATVRAIIRTSSPQVELGGGSGGVVRVSDRFTVGGAISSADVATINAGAFQNFLAVRGGRTLTAAPGTVTAILGSPSVNLAGFNLTNYVGMSFAGTVSNSGGAATLTNFRVIAATGSTSAPTTNWIAAYLSNPTGSVAPATAIGIDGQNFSVLASPAAYGYRQADLPNSPISRALELGPIGAPWLRLLLSGEWVPAVEQTPLYLVEGVVPTLRNVQWMDPGAGGANFVGGERVMVLV